STWRCSRLHAPSSAYDFFLGFVSGSYFILEANSSLTQMKSLMCESPSMILVKNGQWKEELKNRTLSLVRVICIP
ncbi:hypothetical protein VDS34_21700, partial [Xanthomonas campestris pv. campestris]|nr:hypothetical protein [Xanthomonas campestris pv. campestris]